jgi:hypothetical protein
MRRTLFAALLCFTISACGAGWHRVDPVPSTLIPARKQVLVYHGGAVERWHATTLTSDSIAGVHWLDPIECDSCRTSLPLTAVDSIEIGDPSDGFRNSVGLGYGLMLAFLWFTCTQTTICTGT